MISVQHVAENTTVKERGQVLYPVEVRCVWRQPRLGEEKMLQEPFGAPVSRAEHQRAQTL